MSTGIHITDLTKHMLGTFITFSNCLVFIFLFFFFFFFFFWQKAFIFSSTLLYRGLDHADLGKRVLIVFVQRKVGIGTIPKSSCAR